ncbi:MAG: ANTAR domain-containing protein, partial [Marmoricola sp.]
KGRAFGGLNIFVGSGVDPNPALGQFYADLATVALVHPGELAADALVDRVRAAIDARVVIEQAKGALAYQRDLEIHHAYHVLLEEARSSGTGLREYATRILAQAMGR